jgi:hypothetical protein
MSSVLSKRGFLAAIVVALFLFNISFAHAASGVPTVFSYQGRLTDSGGNLLGSVSGTTYYFKFSIWNLSTGGTSGANRLWPSSDPSSVPIVVRQGVFNKDIDTSSFNFNTSSDIYLQVEVSSDSVNNFETLDPRQRISAAPFAQVSGAVSGTGQSSFGTVNPFGTSLVSIQSTSTQSTGLTIRGFAGQLSNLFQIQDSNSANLFVVDNSGKVGVGATAPSRKLEVLDTTSAAQLRVSQASSAYGELEANSSGDLLISSSNDVTSRGAGYGGNVRMQDENLWVCANGFCNATIAPSGKGNIVVKTGVIFDNKFRLEQTGVSTTIMYDTTNNPIFEFDESDN